MEEFLIESLRPGLSHAFSFRVFKFLIYNNSVEKYNNIDSRFRSHIISFVSYLLTIISNIELTRETIPVKNFQKEFIHELEIVKSTANNFLDEPSK